MLDHVVPEQLLVVDADEAEDGDGGGHQPADEGRRLEPGPGVAGAEPIHSLDTPEVEGQGAQDHDHGDGVEGGGEELAPPQRRQRGGGQQRRSCAVHRTAAPSGGPGRPSAHVRAGCCGSAVLPDSLRDAPRAVERHGVERGHLGVVHPPAQRAGVVLGLLPVLRAGDGDGTLGDDPGQGDLARGAPAVRRRRSGAARPRSGPPSPSDGSRSRGSSGAGWRRSTCRSGGPGRWASRPAGPRPAPGSTPAGPPSRAWCAGARTRSGWWPGAGPVSAARRRSTRVSLTE